jgi:hypothetical protein
MHGSNWMRGAYLRSVCTCGHKSGTSNTAIDYVEYRISGHLIYTTGLRYVPKPLHLGMNANLRPEYFPLEEVFFITQRPRNSK